MATTVTYKGATLTTVNNATVTLDTAGTWVEDDFTLTDVTGGGGGGIQIGVQNTPIPNILNMFYALENGTAATGQFTPASAFPNTSTEVFDTGLTTVHGIFIADESQDALNTGTTPDNTLFAVIFNPGTTTGDYAFTRATSSLSYYANSNGANRGFLIRVNAFEVTNGKLFVTCAFNSNDNYTPFHSGHTYRWVAW